MPLAYSLEPLTESQLQLAGLPGTVEIVDRGMFFCRADVHPYVEALICRDRDDLTAVLQACAKLKFLYVVSAGVEKLPFAALRARGVTVCNAGGVNAEAMSQYAMAQILAHSAKVRESLVAQQERRWIRFQCTDDLNGKTLFIAGAGRSGVKLAQKAKAFGLHVVGARDPVEAVAPFDEVVSLAVFDARLGEADFIVCALPLTEKTDGHFNAPRFAQMKPTALFVNMSRGGLVQTADLVAALQAGRPAAAVLDVFDREPVPSESALWDVPNLFLTPHMAGRTSGFMDDAMRVFNLNFTAYRRGEALPNKVDLENGY